MANLISIKDLDVHDLVRGLADVLGSSCDEDNNEICFNILPEKGKGYVKGVRFSNGMSTLDIDLQLKEPLSLKMSLSTIQPLRILFNREATLGIRFMDKEDAYEVRRLESAFVSGNSRQHVILELPAELPICFFSLEINRKLFEVKIDDFLTAMNVELEQLFRDVNGINSFFYKGHYSLDIAKAIEESLECELLGFTRSVFMEGKAYEILAHQLRLYLDDLSGPEKRKILRQSTVELIESAAGIIKSELENLENIISLANRVGLNQNTLQSGFKHLYGMSVNKYIRQAKIEKARELIETTDLNVTEITYKIGINSRSYFSKLFKERYFMSPREYMAKVRGGTSSGTQTG